MRQDRYEGWRGVRRRLVAIVLGAVVVGVTLAAPPAAHADRDGFNKSMLGFNRWMLRWVYEPVARGYNFVMPKWGQRRVGSFFDNLDGPRDIVNSTLQAKFRRAGTHGGRFIVNTTLGIVGFFDVGYEWFGWDAAPETLNETFGVWGIPGGPYLVLPFFGDTSPRHMIGTFADGFMNPITVVVPIFVTIGPVGTNVVWGASQFLLRGTNVLAGTMPSPWASRAEWDAYHRGKFDFPPYEIGRENFLANERDRIEE
jgi:phospholipid-binding lipoprotein MlaA